MKHASLFSGIGGFDLAADWMGWDNVLQCEYDEFCQTILNYYWPYATQFKDIETTDFTAWHGAIDILTGGFPCQPFSAAGERKGTEDERHLWPEMLRAISEIKPQWVVGENVSGIVNWDEGLVFEQVQADLEAEGYEVQPFILPASGINAPHHRQRCWFVANAISNGTGGATRENAGAGKSERLQQRHDLQRPEKPASLRPELESTTPHTEQQGLEGAKFNSEGSAERAGWQRVVFADDCEYEDWDTDGEMPFCPYCGEEYSECPCPGPMQEDIYEYEEFDGVLYARAITDTIEQGCEGSEQRGTSEERYWQEAHGSATQLPEVQSWTRFPTTQPTVRRGDDGFPQGLDTTAISAAKWRRESIKGYGNAIVPQVALQIFKAIAETDAKMQASWQQK